MDWSVLMLKHGWRTEQVGSEPFTPLGLQVQQARANGQAIAKITMQAGTARQYGEVRVSATVSIECPQTEAAIDLAAAAAFWKAAELVNDAASHVEAPELSVPVGGHRG